MPATTGATRHSSRSLIASIAPTLVPSASLAPQCEHMFSALPLRADIAEQSRHVRFVPKSDIASITGRSELFLPSTLIPHSDYRLRSSRSRPAISVMVRDLGLLAIDAAAGLAV